jgi:SH3-like domain-containing protein
MLGNFHRQKPGLRGRGMVLAIVLALVLPATQACAQTKPRPRPERLPDTVQATTQGNADAATGLRPKPRNLGPGTANATATVNAAPIQRGPVTKLPLPRFVSLKGGEGNARRGPGLTHRIDWVFTTKGTPLRVTAEYENWRRVEDFEGFGGWVHFTLLSMARSVLITQDMAQFYRTPDATSTIVFQAERGVLARLLECNIDWCRVNADGQRGWAPKSVMWGVDPFEEIE